MSNIMHRFPRSHLSEQTWHSLRQKHRDAIVPYSSAFRDRRSAGHSHPIYDFLFTYYTFSPAKLESWHPGHGVTLEILDTDQAREFIDNDLYEYLSPNKLTVSLSKIRNKDLKQLVWVYELNNSILTRPARFSCFGLHEWAMVYKSPSIRHSYPLRLKNSEIENFLERSTVVCSHFDAFRFFTKPATSLNILEPSKDKKLQFEQGGCLHANMDLYKWIYKLAPWVGSQLLLESFLLAVKAREIDMRASPYDFADLGFAPIKIETAEGQDEYKEEQSKIALMAFNIRNNLLTLLRDILAELYPDNQYGLNYVSLTQTEQVDP